MTAIDTMKKTIHCSYLLERDKLDWLLKNDGVKLRMLNSNSIGFSLDNQNYPPFRFLSSNSPEHIAKMCDAIIALWHRDSLWIFVIEQKTNNPNHYKKQIANGKFFCDWLLSLYKHHKYYAGKTQYIGVLTWKPRSESVLKGTTSHRNPPVVREDPVLGYRVKIQNRTTIFAKEILDAVPSG